MTAAARIEHTLKFVGRAGAGPHITLDREPAVMLRVVGVVVMGGEQNPQDQVTGHEILIHRLRRVTDQPSIDIRRHQVEVGNPSVAKTKAQMGTVTRSAMAPRPLWAHWRRSPAALQ